LSDEEIAETVSLYQQLGTQRAVARHLEVDPKTIRDRLDLAERRGLMAREEGYMPDIDTELPAEPAKPRYRVRAYNSNAIRDLPLRRITCIGDTHGKPGMDMEHMEWIGRYVAEHRPDNVVHIGDALDCESCEFHSAPGS